MLSTNNSSITEWSRIEKIKARINSTIDNCINQGESKYDKLMELRSFIIHLPYEEQEVFLISQTTRNCNIQRFLFEIIKKPKSPVNQIATSDLIASLNLIQGISLLHYPSKKLVALNQRMNILLSFVVTKDKEILVNILETLQAVLADSVETKRVFENNMGLDLIRSTLTSWKSVEIVNHKCIELFAVYLQEETNLPDAHDAETKTVLEKKRILGSLVGTKFVEKLLLLFQ